MLHAEHSMRSDVAGLKMRATDMTTTSLTIDITRKTEPFAQFPPLSFHLPTPSKTLISLILLSRRLRMSSAIHGHMWPEVSSPELGGLEAPRLQKG